MLASLLVTAALAASPYQGTRLLYMGEGSCGHWNEMRGMSHEDPTKSVELNFVLGYIGGRGSLRRDDPLRGVDQASISSWLDNYCSANPLNPLFKAAQALDDELLRRQRPPQ